MYQQVISKQAYLADVQLYVMSEDTSLEEAIQRFQLVENYDEYVEGVRAVLTRVHVQGELILARKAIEDKKKYLMDNRPEFKAAIDQWMMDLKKQAEYDRAMHKARMAEAEAKASIARSEAMSRMKSNIHNRDLDEWVAKTKFKTRDRPL